MHDTDGVYNRESLGNQQPSRGCPPPGKCNTVLLSYLVDTIAITCSIVILIHIVKYISFVNIIHKHQIFS